MQYGFKRWLNEMHELHEDWCANKVSTGTKMQCDMITCAFKLFLTTEDGLKCK